MTDRVRREGIVVTMLKQTGYIHKGALVRLWPGQDVRVDDETAERWVDNDLAAYNEGGSAPILGSAAFHREAARRAAPARAIAHREDLRIAARSGNLLAQRRLRESEETGAPLELTTEPAPLVEPPPRPTRQRAAPVLRPEEQ